MARGQASDSPSAVWAAQAFGLSLNADFEMPGLPSQRAAEGAVRRCGLVLCSDLASEGDWDTSDAKRMFELADDDGRAACTLDAREGDGARIWGRDRGSFFVDEDGSGVRCYPSRVTDWQWRRFLVGQVLPHAALLQGLEILHASSVAIDGDAIVFVGPSRAGKSSVAAQLNARGAALVADDVVSIERLDRVVVAHPGTPMIGLRHEERALWSEEGLEKLGTRVVESETELLVAAANSAGGPCPLRTVYLLNRSSLEERVSFEDVDDPRYLLASTYNNVVQTPERLVRMLDVYSELSRSARVFRVNVPSSATAADVALAVYDHHTA